MVESAYGLTTLFQGRTWHADLGMYYYRARWYLPDGGVFGERGPLGYHDSPSSYQWLGLAPVQLRDPSGERLAIRKYYDQGTQEVGNENLKLRVSLNLYSQLQDSAGIQNVVVEAPVAVTQALPPKGSSPRFESVFGMPIDMLSQENGRPFETRIANNERIAKRRHYDYDVVVWFRDSGSGSSTLGSTPTPANDMSEVYLGPPRGHGFDEAAIGRYLANVATHEIGHQIGLYPWDDMAGKR